MNCVTVVEKRLTKHAHKKDYPRRDECRALALAGSGCAQCRQIIANALGVDAEIAAPIARRRAQVDAGTRIRRSDRTTISSVKPIQRLFWLASIRSAALSDATIDQPICWAVSSARANAASACSPTISGETSG